MKTVVDLAGAWRYISCSGGLTLFDREHPSGWASERPGDVIEVRVFRSALSGPETTEVCNNEGSELRFMGTRSAPGITITTEPGVRLCFRKTKEGWVYLSGLGRIDYGDYGTTAQVLRGFGTNDPGTPGARGPKTLRLGYDRTVASCLKALSSDDPSVREGNARDLGRLAAAQETADVTPKLAMLLKDGAPAVRRGAAEALGLLGVPAGIPALREAAASEADKTTKAYFQEALAVYGGTALFDPPRLPVLGTDESARLYTEGSSGWADRVLFQRMSASANSVSGLSASLRSPNSGNPRRRSTVIGTKRNSRRSEGAGSGQKRS
jgi:hypothetical protein